MDNFSHRFRKIFFKTILNCCVDNLLGFFYRIYYMPCVKSSGSYKKKTSRIFGMHNGSLISMLKEAFITSLYFPIHFRDIVCINPFNT